MPTNKLLEVSPYEVDRGELIGRDPRKLSGEDFKAEGIEVLIPKHAIRQFCLECCGQSESEVRKCVSVRCPLWALRMNGGLSRAMRDHIRGGPAPKVNFKRTDEDDEDEGDE